MAGKFTIPERSAVTGLLVELFSRGENELSYEAISAHVQVNDIRKSNPGALHSARRIVRRENGIDYATIRGFGFKKTDSACAIGIGRQSIQTIHKTSKRGLERMGCAPLEKMTNEEKVQFNAVAAGLGALNVITQSRTIKRLENAQQVLPEKLSLENTLSLFGAKNGDS